MQSFDDEFDDANKKRCRLDMLAKRRFFRIVEDNNIDIRGIVEFLRAVLTKRQYHHAAIARWMIWIDRDEFSAFGRIMECKIKC